MAEAAGKKQILTYAGLKKLEDELQKATDKFIKDVDTAVEEKSKDVLKV